MPQVVAGAALAGGALLSAGSVSALVAAGGLGLTLFQFGTSIALSGISRELAERRATGTSRARTITARSPVAPREIVYGEVRKGGTIIFANTRDSDQLLAVVVAVAGHEVEAIGDIYFNGELAVADGATLGSGRFENWVSAARHLAGMGVSAQSLVADTGGLWAPDHHLYGVAAFRVELVDNFDVYTSGVPNITAMVKGRKVYDPRTATTVWSDNAALCLADYMADATYGLGLDYGTEDGIDTASLIEAANICDENVTLDAGGTEKRYTANGVLSTAAAPKENIQQLLTAMAGRVVHANGKWHIRAGAYRTPAVALNTSHIREAGIAVSLKRPSAENFNGVRGKFVSPDSEWQADDFPAYQSSVYVAEDQSIERWADIELPFTTSPTMAQRLAKIELERARRQVRVQLSGMLSAWQAMTGETINLTYPRYGWTDKPFEVMGMELVDQDGALVPELTLQETSSLLYSWSASEEDIYEASVPTNLPSPWSITPPGTVTLTEELYQSREGNPVKTKVVISWSPSPSGFVRRYEVQAKRTGETVWQAVGITDLTQLTVYDVPSGTFDVRVRAVSAVGVASDWSSSQVSIGGLGTPPANLTGVSIQAWGGGAFIRWERVTDIDVLYGGDIVIRHSQSATPSWQNSVSLTGGSVSGDQTIAYVPLLPGTYLLRARDSTGQLSPTATAISSKGAQVINLSAALSPLSESPTWPGTKTNVTVDTGALVLTSVATEGVYEFSAGYDFTTVKTVRFRREIDVLPDDIGTTIGTRPGLISEWDSITGGTGAEIDVVVEGRFTDDDPSGSPTWTDWTRIDSTEVECRGAEFRIRMISNDPNFNMILNDVTISADEAT